ncbi:InlB B-repeat-containing protein [Halorussus marinus]|uniref:InlB B-repeat-containing protein n=1 Tax=Halorussus marinus TaxID=2505976 RepID=UPI00106DDDDE|nr:hypothetical protein [Halorussus marinus]
MLRESVAVVFAILLVTAPVGGAMGTQLGAASGAAPRGVERPDTAQAHPQMSQARADPEPEMSVDAPDRVTVGDTFDIAVEAENDGGRAGQFSTITVSSPSFSEGDRFDDLSTSLDYKARFDAGEEVYDKDGDRITAEYALAEAGTPGDSYWEGSAEHSFSTEITAEETGTLVFYVRTTLSGDEDPDRKFNAPESPDAYDTQDFGVRRVEVEVDPETESYDLDADTEGDGSLRIYPPGVTTENFDGSYEEDTVVGLTAEPAFESQFTGWEGDVGFADRDDRSIEVTMDQARSLTATFEDETDEYRLRAESERGGDLQIFPPGVRTDNFARTYEEDTEVELVADPDPEMAFEAWEGDVGTADRDDRSIEVTMDQARSLTATFEDETEEHELDVEAEQNGDVRIYPPGVRDRRFSRDYEDGTEVRLVAEPDSESQFTGWEGDVGFADREDRSIEVTMDQARSLTATFEEETAEYRLRADAEQGGDLRISPPGVLTEDFTHRYERNAEVELIADPDPDVEFEAWEGDVGTADREDRSIEVTMDQARSLTATFETPGYELEAETDGDGEVAVSPPGVSTEEFTRTYREETEVRLTATPEGDARFVGWNGDVGFADREDRSIEVTMDRARSLTAVFESETQEYELTARADGDGSVRVVPPNSRNREFSRSYANGTTVRLIAEPEPETQFSGWEGDVGLVDRDDRSIEVTMDRARSLTAGFDPAASKELVVEIDESESTVSRDARVGIQEVEGAEVRVGGDGRAEFDELEPGTYTAYVRSAGHGDVLAVRTVRLERSEDREDVEFSVQGERTVALRLEDTSVPESRESSGEWVVSIPELDASVTAPGDEEFVFEDVPPGEYRVVYRPELTESEYMTFSESVRIADDDETVTIAFNGTEQSKRTLDTIMDDRVSEWQEFGMGFVCGEYCFAEDSHNNVDYLTGWIISGIAIFGDVRDISNYLIEQKGVELGVTVVGLVPAVGDTPRITQIFGKAAKYMEVRKLTKFAARFDVLDSQFVRILDEIHDGAGSRLLDAGFDRQDLKRLGTEGADIGLIDRRLDAVARIEDLSNARGELGEIVARATVIPARYGDDVKVVDNVEIVRANGNSAGEIDHVVVKDGEVVGVWETKSAVDDAGKAGTELRKAMAYVERHEADQITLKGTDEIDPAQFKRADAIDEGTIGPSDGTGYDETMSLSNSELDRIADDVHDG